MVAAGVGRARRCVGVRVAGYDQGVELAHHRHRGARPAGVQHGPGARQRDVPLDGNAQRRQLVGDDTTRALLPVPGLRVNEDVLGNPHGLFAPAVDLRTSKSLELIDGQFSAPVIRRTILP